VPGFPFRVNPSRKRVAHVYVCLCVFNIMISFTIRTINPLYVYIYIYIYIYTYIYIYIYNIYMLTGSRARALMHHGARCPSSSRKNAASLPFASRVDLRS